MLQRGRSKKPKASHDMLHQPEKKQAYRSQRRGKQAEQPAVQHITREAAPLAQQPKPSGMWNRIYHKLFGQATPEKPAKPTPAAAPQPRQQSQRRNPNQQRQRQDRQRQQRNDRQQKPRQDNKTPQQHNTPKSTQVQKPQAPKPVTPPQAPKTPPKPKRDMVKAILNKKTVLSDTTSQQMETQANLAITSQPNINIDKQQFQTEFSLDAVKKTMAERESAIKMIMVKSAVKSQQPK